MDVKRRMFVKMSAAASLAATGVRAFAEAGAPALKLGVISDVHINNNKEADTR